MEEKTRNGILSTLSVNPPRKQRMSFRQRSVTYVKNFLRAFTREKRYPTCFKFRFVSSPQVGGGRARRWSAKFCRLNRVHKKRSGVATYARTFAKSLRTSISGESDRPSSHRERSV